MVELILHLTLPPAHPLRILRLTLRLESPLCSDWPPSSSFAFSCAQPASGQRRVPVIWHRPRCFARHRCVWRWWACGENLCRKPNIYTTLIPESPQLELHLFKSFLPQSNSVNGKTSCCHFSSPVVVLFWLKTEGLLPYRSQVDVRRQPPTSSNSVAWVHSRLTRLSFTNFSNPRQWETEREREKREGERTRSHPRKTRTTFSSGSVFICGFLSFLFLVKSIDVSFPFRKGLLLLS